jgi:hypothetical protein
MWKVRPDVGQDAPEEGGDNHERSDRPPSSRSIRIHPKLQELQALGGCGKAAATSAAASAVKNARIREPKLPDLVKQVSARAVERRK